MADILYLGKKSAGLRPKADDFVDQAAGEADIIFFPGVRYERPYASTADSSGKLDPSENPSNTNCS